MSFNSSSPKPMATTPLSRSALKVLLVDDDSFQLDMISEILQSLGIVDITLSSSGAQALQTMNDKSRTFNLLVMDLHMPGMDGFQFMESVAKTGYNGALIIVSGQSADVMRAATMVAELRRFTLLGAVPKPVGRAALSELISKLA